MSVIIDESNIIKMTRGDTLKATLSIKDKNGNPYTPNKNDRIRFAVKEHYDDANVLIYKDIPYNTLVLTVNPEDTKQLKQNNHKYVYDIQITQADGTVDTIIPTRYLIITNEVE